MLTKQTLTQPSLLPSPTYAIFGSVGFFVEAQLVSLIHCCGDFLFLLCSIYLIQDHEGIFLCHLPQKFCHLGFISIYPCDVGCEEGVKGYCFLPWPSTVLWQLCCESVPKLCFPGLRLSSCTDATLFFWLCLWIQPRRSHSLSPPTLFLEIIFIILGLFHFHLILE